MDTVVNSNLSQDYIPARLLWQSAEPSVQWVYSSEVRYAEPFFDSTLEACMARPFNLLFNECTPIGDLVAWSKTSPGLPVSGLIYHVSRCGSTLIANLLRQLDNAIVLSEPSPVDSVMRAHHTNPSITEAQRVEWVQAMVSALAQKKSAELDRVYIKTDAWHLILDRVLDQAFPETPSIILYRDPIEVLASTMKQRGSFLVPSPLNCALYQIPFAEAATMSGEEYCSFALGQVYTAALRRAREKKSLLLNYAELPEAIWTRLPSHFGFDLSPELLERFQGEIQQNPKTRMAFEPDSAKKQAEATDYLRECAERWIYPTYRQLEELRTDSLGVVRT